jgi:hypothetical protein
MPQVIAPNTHTTAANKNKVVFFTRNTCIIEYQPILIPEFSLIFLGVDVRESLEI